MRLNVPQDIKNEFKGCIDVSIQPLLVPLLKFFEIISNIEIRPVQQISKVYKVRRSL
ncbi:hypothetical protein BROSI_A3828 [Candidatus Brocadia sinica JPN1]|uniref:Uncharacterized protein n=1 Tax=Candidatus Brocadia sinica JPN1 TaxID=1197129 RepID=A0ABQ0K3H6_9BACT|nr:hypothetical protein BROSI_A3828 [Candidatus Brocadia sinica JPN1]GJQ18272.1 MAG: hypothetical protein HBSIN01_22310 [Candidatus Brocadia sinica]